MGRSGRSESCLLLLALVGLLVASAAAYPTVGRAQTTGGHSHYNMNRMERLRASPVVRNDIFAAAASPASNALSPMSPSPSSRVYHVTDYGADPTGKTDATEAIMRAFSDAFLPASADRDLLPGITDLDGAEIDFDGGSYQISSPVRLPSGGRGNVKIHGGSLHASGDFPMGGYLIEMRAVTSSSSSSKTESGTANDTSAVAAGLDYEYITVRDLMLDSNYRGGGIAVINSLRTSIDNCYITHFTSDGILVQEGHETYIRNSYLGQHITAGSDPGEKNFTGVGINLAGNDNAVTDVVIFSAEIGVLVTGQANTLSGVHCYNKATGWGGTGIYLKSPRGLTQTRILNCYLDFTGIVAEDPTQLLISSSFFLGDAYIVLKSVKGVMNGVSIVDNMFSGSDKGAEIVQLDESVGKFTTVEQVIVAGNNVRGMALRSTTAKGSVQGNGSSWIIDFSPVLLFPDRIEFVQYTLATDTGFPVHALRNSSGNKVVVQSATPVSATVSVFVDQSVG